MNKIVVVIICLVIILLGALYFVPSLQKSFKVFPGGSSVKSTTSDAENFSTWQKFVPRSRLFKVMLPHKPQYAKDLLPIPDSDKKRRYDMYASEKIDGSLFLISVITYPMEVDTSFPEDIIRQTVDELMRSKPDNQLSKLDKNLLRTKPAFDFSIDNKDFHVEGQVIMDDKTVYVLSYIARKDEFDPIEYQYFIDSFQLLNTL
jgi:hypothetical protein